MRITTKGQVTIPAHIREKAGFLPNTEVDFLYEGRGRVRLMRATKSKRTSKPTRGELLVKRLTGSGDVKMTTDEIMALTRGD